VRWEREEGFRSCFFYYVVAVAVVVFNLIFFFFACLGHEMKLKKNHLLYNC